MAVFDKPNYTNAAARTKKREIPEGLWTKCVSCGEVIFNKELENNLMVCKSCGHHFSISARDRIESLLDPGSWQEMDAQISSVDTLKFTGVTSYAERLKAYQKKTNLKDAVVAGL